MTHILNLLYGDKQSPTRELSLTNFSGGLYMSLNGFAPGAGENTVVFSGRSVRFDGQQRVNSSRDNTRLTLTYSINAANTQEAQLIQNKITRYAEEVRQYRERFNGSKVWLEYRWNETDALDSLPRPVWGQLNYYLEIYELNVRAWPDNLHDGTLLNGNVVAVQLDIVGAPYWEGLEQAVLGAQAIPAAAANAGMNVILTNSEFYNSWTASGWVKVRSPASSFTYLQSIAGASDQFVSSFQNTTFRVSGSVNGTVFSISDTFANYGITADAVHHIAISYDHTTGTNDLKLYVNGGTVDSASTGETVGFEITSSNFGFGNYDDDIESWRVWNTVLSADHISALYTYENATRATGETLPKPLYAFNNNNGTILNNVDGVLGGTAKDNWLNLSYVPGDAPALMKMELALPAGTISDPHYYLGMKSLAGTILPDSTHWLDFSGVAGTATNSGDAYAQQQLTAAGTVTHTATLNENANARGAFRVLAHFRNNNGNGDTATVKPFFQLGASNVIYGESTTVADVSTFRLYDFGELIIDWPDTTAPPTLKAGLEVVMSTFTGGTTNLDLDFIQLLPAPHCRIEAEDASMVVASGDDLVIKRLRAWVQDASDSNSQLYHMSYYGEELNPVPNHYNYIYLIQGEDTVAYTVDRNVTAVVRITPRYRLPGGMVA